MTVRDDWDAEETQALAGLEQQLEIVRRRQAEETPVDLLSAARQQLASQQPFDRVTEQRIWRRIQRAARQDVTMTVARRWWRWAAGAAAVAATVTIAIVINREAPPPIRSARVRVAPPPVVVEFTKPEVKLSPAVLTWRGPGDAGAYARDLEPALDAYRAGNYAESEKLFAALAARYPQPVEGVYFLGASRMLRNDFEGAIEPLAAAVSRNEPALVDDASWYLAVAEQRSGRLRDALRRFGQLCSGTSAHASESCRAQELLTHSR